MMGPSQLLHSYSYLFLGENQLTFQLMIQNTCLDLVISLNE